jgi:hypothetical protein
MIAAMSAATRIRISGSAIAAESTAFRGDLGGRHVLGKERQARPDKFN